MIEKYYQMVLLVREGQQVVAWLDQQKVQEGATIEMLELPDPRDLWTVRHISNNIINEQQYQDWLKRQKKINEVDPTK